MYEHKLAVSECLQWSRQVRNHSMGMRTEHDILLQLQMLERGHFRHNGEIWLFSKGLAWWCSMRNRKYCYFMIRLLTSGKRRVCSCCSCFNDSKSCRICASSLGCKKRSRNRNFVNGAICFSAKALSMKKALKERRETYILSLPWTVTLRAVRFVSIDKLTSLQSSSSSSFGKVGTSNTSVSSCVTYSHWNSQSHDAMLPQIWKAWRRTKTGKRKTPVTLR